jgi:2-oxoglutarate ferredoxin oxidoreductase subunit alpha
MQVTSIKFAAPAGAGVKSVGQVLSKILIKHQQFVSDYSEYPSLVRGGHNTYQVSFSPKPLFAPYHTIDFLFSIAPGHWQQNVPELSDHGLFFSDEELTDPKGLSVPFKDLAIQAGSILSANIVALGVIGYLLNFDQSLSKDVIKAQFTSNSETNLKAFDLGYEFASKNFSNYTKPISAGQNQTDTELTDGNESFAWGFIQGKGDFYAAYPMTPATGVLHLLAEKQKDYPLAVVHPEDEIAAANMATGAAFAGKRSATGTSGGGFALMNEAVSFAAVAELGVVFYLASRPGPATGLPTWTSQGDLLHAIFSGHGEFPLVVLAPGSREESFDFGVQSLNLAAQLQTPIIVVTDKFLAESASSVPDFSKTKVEVVYLENPSTIDSAYKRYTIDTKTGASPVAFPGQPNGQYLANSYEHDEYGFSTEDAKITESMVEKRNKKNTTAKSITPKAEIFGNDQADTLIVSWGSTRGPILESLRILNDPKFAFIQIKTLWPIQENLKKIFDSFKKIIVIENNATGQLTTLLKSQFDFNPDHQILRYDGRPFYPEELVTKLSSL